MATLLHIDFSARPGASGATRRGSHTRRLTARFVAAWRLARPADRIIRRDVGMEPPTPVSAAWIEAAFTPPAAPLPRMVEALAESDALVDELIAADLVVAGVPMYNFGVPASLKAYIDNIVRVGRTFGFDRARVGEPYWPLLAGQGKRLVVLSARGDFGYDGDGRVAHLNHVEPMLRAVFGYLGITEMEAIAVENDEFGGGRLAASLARAEAAVDALARQLLGEPLGRAA